ncbi:MFS transporter [Nocardia cyriacigeorgica]|uniref:MDR family MFS transporter n=1 Tax=Nocardia cyriacigeorgica TaxID=135487 RepID=UPI0013BA4D27|nr:MDR family MFS transporter [Nocardia cyriacigeorgica]NEW48989.1 MFS transporter [Nocardia cyriacigeorgica]
MSVSVTVDAPVARPSNVAPATAGLAIGMLLSVLDQTIVSIALPDIAVDFGDVGSLSWIVTCYVLASTATAALYGRLSDRFGRRPVFLAAITIFTVASALCGMAGSLPRLIAFRTLQGIGAGALFTVPTIALAELFPVELRGRVQGAVGAIFAVAAVGGPLLGGVITDAVGWRWIFYINVPLGVLSAVLVAAALRLPRGAHTIRLDVVGSILLLCTVVGILLITELSSGSSPGSAGTTVALGAAAIALLSAFIWWERRTTDPVLPMHLFTGRTTGVVLAATAVLGALMFATIVYLPTYLRSAFGMSATAAGLALNPYVLAFVVTSFVTGTLVTRTGQPRPFLIAGAAVIAVAVGLLGQLGAESAFAVVAVELAMLGLGVGMVMQLLVTVAQNSVAPTDLAAVTAAVLSVRGLGMALGIAVYGRILSHQLDGEPNSATSTAEAIPHTLLLVLPLAAILLLLTIALPHPSRFGDVRS